MLLVWFVFFWFYLTVLNYETAFPIFIIHDRSYNKAVSLRDGFTMPGYQVPTMPLYHSPSQQDGGGGRKDGEKLMGLDKCNLNKQI